MTGRTETRQRAAERLLTATDTAIRAGLTLPCTELASNTVAFRDALSGEAWLSDDENQRAQATTACRSCPVIAECRTYAETHQTTFGVYGGHDFTTTNRKGT